MFVLTHVRDFDLEELVEQHYDTLYCVCIIIVLFVLKSLTIFVIPQVFVYAAAGMLFPPVKAVLLCLLGLALEYCINYIIGRSLGSKAIDRIWAYFEGKGRKRTNNSLPGVMAMYFLPGASRDLLGMMMGASGMPFVLFLPAAVGGSLPKMVVTVLIGGAAVQPLSHKFIIPLAVLVIATAAITIWHKRQGNKTEKDDASQLKS